jgi:hypothetical protein
VVVAGFGCLAVGQRQEVAEITDIAHRYGAALAARDLDALRRNWSTQSPKWEAQLEEALKLVPGAAA